MGAITSLSAVTSAATNGSSSAGENAAPAPQQQPQSSTNTSSDTVQLTEAQQVYQLYNQGVQVSQIATTLNLTVAAVNSYLNISGTGS
jgi:DNA-binding NarL/FixJ family response regulator